jgi:hypothetical protein
MTEQPGTERISREEYLAQNARLARKKPSKYKAKRTKVDGIVFDSGAEAKRYGELLLLARAGSIEDLQLQPRFALIATTAGGGCEQVADYVADFQYTERPPKPPGARADATTVVEDVKGAVTRMYALKRKMFKLQYPHIDFREIKAPSRRRKVKRAKNR